MAARTSSKKILENEKYMDDVVSSIFSNLHRAAKKKSEYIWSLNKFSSDSIWGALDSDKSETNPPAKDLNSECKSSGGNSTPNTNKMYRKYQEGRQRSNASMSGTTTSHPQRSFDPDVLLTENSKIVNLEKLSPNRRPGNREQAMKTLGGPSVSSVTSKERNFFPNTDSFDTTEVNRNMHAKNHFRGEETPSYKQNLVDSKMKVTADVKHFRQEEQRKRTRHSSGSTTSSIIASQRKSPKRTGLEEFNSKCTVPKTMLTVKIVQEDHCSEFIIKNSDFNHIMSKLPKVKEFLPDIDAEEKIIDFCAEAVKIVLGSLFNPPYNFNSIPEGRTAVEIIAVSKAWELNVFHNKFLQTFLNNLTKESSKFVYAAASHYGLSEISDACRTFLPDSKVRNSTSFYRRKQCSLSISTYVEPREFDFNLQVGTDTFQDSFPKDIKNCVTFQAVSGSFFITGFHVLLNSANIKSDSAICDKINICYEAKKLTAPNEGEQVTVSKPLRGIIVIHFRKKLLVNQDETAEISVEASGRPDLCLVATESTERVRNQDGNEFVLNLTSTNKENKISKMKRFLVGKLLYYPKTK